MTTNTPDRFEPFPFAASPCFVVRVVSQDVGTGYAVYDSNGAFLAMFSDPAVCQATVDNTETVT